MTATPRPRIRQVDSTHSEPLDDEVAAPPPHLYGSPIGDGADLEFEAAVQTICSSLVPKRPK